ncbi:MAG: SPFH domain-containing protein [Polyangiaceae bacterium]
MLNVGVVGGEWFLALASAARRRKGSVGVDPEELLAVMMIAGGCVIAFILLVAVLKKFLFICGPHEILVFSGRKEVLRDGSVANYTTIHGGMGVRRPFVETVKRMDMRLFPVEVVSQNAYSRGGIPLTVRAIANVKLASNPVALRNAVERFLDYHPSQIALAAQQTLEGVLREVVSQLTPEEVNEDRLKFAEYLMENAKDDFDKLGLELDVLKVQHVADDQDYLANLGRARIAEMLRDAENAENAANQAVAEAEAEARNRAESATKEAETKVIKARNNAGTELAELDARAKQVENHAAMAVETARVIAEQKMQERRAELEKLRLHCDVVLPAAADRMARELRARGEVAPTVENGKASAEALKLVAEQWTAAGPVAREVYALQQLKRLAAAASSRVAASSVEQIRLVAGDEKAYVTVLASYPAAVSAVLRETASALGLDLDQLLGAAHAAANTRGGAA